MDSTNTYRFGQMELALPQSWDVVFFKKPVGNKGLRPPSSDSITQSMYGTNLETSQVVLSSTVLSMLAAVLTVE